MFSGITRGLFPCDVLKKNPTYMLYRVYSEADFISQIKSGDSVSVDGVCQTVVVQKEGFLEFEAIAETLEKTSLKDLKSKDLLSLEPSLRYGDQIGGHLSSGHVIGTAQVFCHEASKENLSLTLICPKEWLKCILPKGFITLDGSSLTVACTWIEDAFGFFKVHLIPETRRLCKFEQKKEDSWINVELDAQTQAIVQTVETYLKNNHPLS